MMRGLYVNAYSEVPEDAIAKLLSKQLLDRVVVADLQQLVVYHQGPHRVRHGLWPGPPDTTAMRRLWK
jgi:hypothetical protein